MKCKKVSRRNNKCNRKLLYYWLQALRQTLNIVTTSCKTKKLRFDIEKLITRQRKGSCLLRKIIHSDVKFASVKLRRSGGFLKISKSGSIQNSDNEISMIKLA